ncbi:MAG: sigma-70 family RNA polymerase sigma factor [bacterium]|nr:sigma-70 family RNA polymerase sigma factor [bacterium]
MSDPQSDNRQSPSTAEASVQLILRARGGDRRALESLFRRYVPAMRRWAAGRLPRWTRDMLDTDDLIQDTLLRTCRRLESFEPRHDGALEAYLRQALRNRIADEVRRMLRRGPTEELSPAEPSPEASPLEEAIGSQMLARYEGALQKLSEDERRAVVARVEMGKDYAEIARDLGKPTADAARMAVSRALLRVAREMGHGRR